MTSKEYNNTFNQGVEAAAKVLDSYILKPTEVDGQTRELTTNHVNFILLLAGIKDRILNERK